MMKADFDRVVLSRKLKMIEVLPAIDSFMVITGAVSSR